MSASLILRAWVELLYMDVIGVFGFGAMHRVISRTHTSRRTPAPDTIACVVKAMKHACVLYVKPAQCLQRSAVVTRLLRRHGVAAELVIGCHPSPLKGHAWVEVSGDVVSDHMDGIEFFRVLDRW